MARRNEIFVLHTTFKINSNLVLCFNLVEEKSLYPWKKDIFTDILS